MVAIWRVNKAMSLGLIFLPERIRRFLILVGKTPWRRSVACTWFSPPARISPRTILPLPVLAFPFEDEFFDVSGCGGSHVSPRRYRDGLLCVALFVGDGQHFFQRGQAHACTLCRARFAQRIARLRASAWLAISRALPSAKMMRCISSEIGITW